MIATIGIISGVSIMGYGVMLLRKLITNHASHIQASLADLKAISTSSTVRIVNAAQATTSEIVGLRSDIKSLMLPRVRAARRKRR